MHNCLRDFMHYYSSRGDVDRSYRLIPGATLSSNGRLRSTVGESVRPLRYYNCTFLVCHGLHLLPSRLGTPAQAGRRGGFGLLSGGISSAFPMVFCCGSSWPVRNYSSPAPPAGCFRGGGGMALAAPYLVLVSEAASWGGTYRR